MTAAPTATTNPAIKEALAKVTVEEHRLEAEQLRLEGELVKIRAVRRMLETQAGISQRPRLAPPGALQGQILAVLGKTPMSRGQVIEAIRKAKYSYSLTPLHVTKHLIQLTRAGKVKRVGTGTGSAYIKVK